MTNFINLSQNPKKPLYIDVDNITHIQSHVEYGSGRKLVVLSTKNISENIFIDEAKYETTAIDVVNSLKAASVDFITVSHTRGINENAEDITEYINPAAITFFQIHPNPHRPHEFIIDLGIQGIGTRGYFHAEKSFSALNKGFYATREKKHIAVVSGKDLIPCGNRIAFDLHIDTRAIELIETRRGVHSKIRLREGSLINLALSPNVIPTQEDFQNARDAGVSKETSREVAHKVVSAYAHIRILRELVLQTTHLVEFPSAWGDLNQKNETFHTVAAYFVNPDNFEFIRTIDKLDTKDDIYNYHMALLKYKNSKRISMENEIQILFPTAAERDAAIQQFQRNCVAKLKTPAPSDHKTPKGPKRS